jgi:hypothetical protein
MSSKPIAAVDCEVYRNFFLVQFKRLDTGAVRYFEMHDDQPLEREALLATMRKLTLVSFNGIKYDMPILGRALKGATCEQIKEMSDLLIVGNVPHWKLTQRFECELPRLDHIDLIEVVPGFVSLKVYMGRLHCSRLQDLPIEHDSFITPEQRDLLRQYCENDLDGTLALLQKFRAQIELRTAMSDEYGFDLRSKSDAQIAEVVIREKVSAMTGVKASKPEVLAKTFYYRAPEFLSHASRTAADVVAMVRDTAFVVDDGGYVKMPESLAKAKIRIGSSVYRMGIGGLHSSEQTAAHRADEHTLILDRDVASYYPAIIIETGLYPEHLGLDFLSVYRGIRDTRIAAKRAGQKTQADTLKIVLNGSFGKFGSPYSILYSPDLLIQTTLTGQLSLLMLIEWLEEVGVPVVSANTDGIVLKCPVSLYDDACDVFKEWEKVTGFETEETRYRALYSRDVNNYIALKEKGGCKLKGAYAEPEPVASSWPSPHNQICVAAACEYLEHGTPVELTILGCNDIRQFLTVRTVNGGAMWGDRYVGKAVRWYTAKGGFPPMVYRKNGNKVPKSDSCMPCMELPAVFPADVDHDYYIKEAQDILRDIGAM